MMGQHGVIAQQHGGSCGNAAHLIGGAFPFTRACTPRISWGCWAAADASLRETGELAEAFSGAMGISASRRKPLRRNRRCVLRHRPR